MPIVQWLRSKVKLGNSPISLCPRILAHHAQASNSASTRVALSSSFLPNSPHSLGNSVAPERNLGDKDHPKGEFQNTLIPHPAYRLLLTPSSYLLPVPSSLLPSDRSTAALQHRSTYTSLQHRITAVSNPLIAIWVETYEMSNTLLCPLNPGI